MGILLFVGEALVEVMRTTRDLPLDRPGELVGPFPSGAPAIAASAAARLGADVAFVGSVGADAFGDCIARRLREDGVDCRALRIVTERLTGIAFVSYRTDGSRQFVFHLPLSAAALVSPDQIPPGLVDHVSSVHIMGSALTVSESLRETCYALAAQVHSQGATVSLDPNLRPELMDPDRIRQICEPVVRTARVVMPSGEELTGLTGAGAPQEGAAILLGLGVEIVALKQGQRGSTIFTPEGAIAIPPYSVDEHDPTGAGDCYDAAFLIGLDEGWGLERTGLFANAVGALATTRVGPMEGTFTRHRVLAFMASQGRPLPPA